MLGGWRGGGGGGEFLPIGVQMERGVGGHGCPNNKTIML